MDMKPCKVGFLLALLGLAGALACVPPPKPVAKGGQEESSAEPSADSLATDAGPEPPLPGIKGSAALRAELDAVVAAKGKGYVPRTQHLREDGSPIHVNRLIHESSPYLLQHAHNPVNWHPWGDEAFEKAATSGRPVLLSVGYSTCHWCHVMERESFEDEEIAAFINTHFVAIKVDREQRPDVDDIYMTAVQMMTGRGGWPMTVVLTPEREPFFAGTYFPARDGDRGARKGFLTILEELDRDYRESPGEVVERAQEVSRRIAASARGGGRGRLPGSAPLAAAAEQFADGYDDQWGGFGKAPKFPRPAIFEFLLKWGRRAGDAEASALASQQTFGTLDRMIEGGIHDHVGGGFHRYSTDRRWLVPHFEKMLYDNAQLVTAFLDAWQLSGAERYERVTRETLNYLMREMSAPSGGFYSATDADSPVPGKDHQEEGWFFTWTERELVELLSEEETEAVQANFATSVRGNFERRNIFHTPKSADEVAQGLEIPREELDARVASALPKLYTARAKRPPPLRDDKILASWNGLALSAFARAGFVLDDPRYLTRARTLAAFLLEDMRDGEGRLLRSIKDGQSSGRGYLDDHAFVIQGLLDMYEADGDPRWLEAAIALQAQLDLHHLDAEHGGYFTTADDGEALLARQKPDYDGAEPSGNSVAALNLLRLHQLTGREEFRKRGVGTLAAFSSRMTKGPRSVPKMLSALDYALDRPLQIFLVGPGQEAPDPEMVAVLRKSFVPNRALVMVAEDQVPAQKALIPGMENKVAMKGKTTAYVCEENVCQLPSADPGVFRKQLEKTTPYEP
jgi:uncharacterized protein YyaL (SSP411 family)